MSENNKEKPKLGRKQKYGEPQVHINELVPISGEKVVRELIKFIRESKLPKNEH